ncbi:MAG TPA: hypothetical protein VHO28_03015, partial [Ignavibacteriales bacterium]|nr:hypothetical protein [Ignavibacteriales bacterium]
MLILILPVFSFAQDNNFILSTKNFNPYFPAFIGNGHFSLSTSQLGTQPAESYMIKVYDRGKDDIPRLANLPAWNEINYSNGSGWLNDMDIDTAKFGNYSQTLDMYSGTLETKYSWTVNSKKSDINVLSFISRKNNNLAVIKFELTTDFSDTVALSFPLNERDAQKRMSLAKLDSIAPDTSGNWPPQWYPGIVNVTNIRASNNSKSGSLYALAQSEGKDTKTAQAVEVAYEGIQNPKITSYQTGKSAGIEIKFLSEKGKKYTFYKFVSIASEIDDGTEYHKKAIDVCKAAKTSGFDKLLAEHKEEWRALWRTDIIVKGDDDLQKTVRSMIFYLLCSIDENTGFSLPPMGLATSGYYGHIFWDADTYMFPPLLFMHPEMAKSMVMFRINTLKSAEENARKNNYTGAMYPWEADELGEETTPFFAYQNAIKENHIVGDVALAQWQYYLATKDENWLREHGSKVITACAQFWTSRVHYNDAKDRYEIGKLVSVSEGMIDINNETYTNSIAKLNLEIAAKIADILNMDKNPEWEKISKKLFIPFDEENQFHPTYENAPMTTKEGAGFWSSVAPLLSFPLQMDMSMTAKKNDLQHALTAIDEIGAGAMMGVNFLPLIAAELEDDNLFNLAIQKTDYKKFQRPPFKVLAETPENKSINFITGAGAFLQQVIFGYTGLRLTENGLIPTYKPMLPRDVKSLTLKNFTIGGRKYDIVVKNANLELNPK